LCARGADHRETEQHYRDSNTPKLLFVHDDPLTLRSVVSDPAKRSHRPVLRESHTRGPR
jgi:hypothetical protein